jgi:hypothetical protein
MPVVSYLTRQDSQQFTCRIYPDRLLLCDQQVRDPPQMADREVE